MKKIIAGFVLGLCVVPLAAYIFLISGGMPVATQGPPLPLEKFIVRTAMHVALKGTDHLTPPFDATEPVFLSGAKVYRNNCMACHGLPGQPQTSIAKGMFPQPPQLFDAEEMVTDDPVGKIYWKTKNGIRLTGMPGFSASLSEQELWQVTLLLANADKISPSVKLVLSGSAH